MNGERFDSTGAAFIRGWVAKAEQSLADGNLPMEKRVHLLRVSGKRLRALLLLAGEGKTPPKWSRKHAKAIRGAARALGPCRNAAVMDDLLGKRVDKERSQRMSGLWQRWVAARASNGDQAAPPGMVMLTRLLLAVEEAEERFVEWLRSLPEPEPLRHGWDSSVVRLRDHADLFFKQPGDEAAHDWRKRVKELWHQTEWLHAMGMEIPLEESKTLDKLSSALGRANDFAVLQAHLWEDEGLPFEGEERLFLDGHLERQKRKAWHRAGVEWRSLADSLPESDQT